MKTVFLFLFILFHLSVFSQVVNIENQYLEDGKDGFSGALDLSFSIQKQTDKLITFTFKPIFQYRFGKKFLRDNLMQDTLKITDTAKVQRDSIIATFREKADKIVKGKHLFLLYHDINYTGTKGKTFSNYGLSHLRYVYEITKNWKSESYSQIEYNQLLLQKVRYLLGSGIRANILNIKAKEGEYKNKAIRISAGTSLFFEYNEINHVNRPLERRSALRWNSYLSTYFNFKFFEFTSTTYIQPNLGNLKDFKSSGDYSVLFRVSNPFSIKFDFSFYYDAIPPDQTPDNTYSFTAGFVYKLNHFRDQIRKIRKKYETPSTDKKERESKDDYNIIID